MIFDIFDRFATKEDVLGLNLRLARLEQAQKDKKLESEEPGELVKQLHRILENYIPARITSQSYECDVESVGLSYRHTPRFTYIYKDGREYKIPYLALYKPEFEVLDTDNILRVVDYVETKDQYHKIEYVIDLEKSTFIQTRAR